MNVREAIETIGMQRLAELAGCTRTTIDRTKVQKGVISGNHDGRAHPAGDPRPGAIPLDGDRPDRRGATRFADPDQPIVSQIQDAALRQKLAAAAEKERKNAEAEGRLLPADEVASRIGHAGAQLRTVVDGVRREIEAQLPDDLRAAILETYDAGFKLGLDAVTKAWEA